MVVIRYRCFPKSVIIYNVNLFNQSVLCRNTPAVTQEKSPPSIKPTQSLELSDTDDEKLDPMKFQKVTQIFHCADIQPLDIIQLIGSHIA